MDRKKIEALLELAGIKYLKLYEIVNEYWHDNSVMGPWWLVQTKYGMIKIGWRNRVINIDWSDTPIRVVVTEHEVTRGEHMVHAYTYHNAVEYLSTLAANFPKDPG